MQLPGGLLLSTWLLWLVTKSWIKGFFSVIKEKQYYFSILKSKNVAIWYVVSLFNQVYYELTNQKILSVSFWLELSLVLTLFLFLFFSLTCNVTTNLTSIWLLSSA